MAAPKLRFKEFDGDWIKSKLGSEAQFFQGEQVSLDDQCSEYAHGLIKFLRIENFTQKSKDFRYIRYTGSQEKILVEQDIAIVRYGATAGFICSGETGVIANNLFKVSVDNKKINQKYLELVLKSEKTFNYFQAEMSGGAMPALNFKIVGNLDITYSSIQEQTKIASFLSTVDEKISQLTQKHELLGQYKQGMMQKLFSQQIRFKADDGSEFGEWNKFLLGDCVDILTNGLSLDQNMNGNGFKVTRIETISNFNIDLSRVGYVDTQSDISSYRLVVGDILFSNINSIAHIGKVVYIDKDYDIYHGMNLLRIQFKKNLDKKFMFYELSQKTFKQHFESIANKAVNQASINQTALKKTELCAPCLEEQIKIANFLSAIDQKIEVVAEQIEQAKTWKKGLLQQMFI
ncbi:restriction endonuclease subunit S [Acinetobacter sp.]|uniref:restriction endonuclease subunit S n=1 Tax=Acinetobacter sp. TaxID=472 RepID=UPI0025BB6EAF|nr:restriction endonuclease subunit S [Acinetobacter sp.]